ncbi:ribonuclease R [Synechococcus sp. PCC 6717]|uniref:RNB domain-containing ribonuclease n=1 Tax=Parathermosynechococcus lividus PCC 6715 TaxID=1917166 RepID=A0A2D2Q0K2_PARLV|nr:ribonuclease R family protein [Thermostichus lividus]ATS18041.1 RNB domain-containing ribonuclease [Thermostichus lividus PCC 6715]MCI3279610.1 ribonuclease R [Synechococcus sp. PCC 6717]
MEKGTLIEFRVQNQRRLATIDRPEGKKLWIAMDQHLQSHTLHPRHITFTVPHERFRPQDIPAFWQQVQSLLDPESLEVAWEIIREEQRTITPQGLAELLFGETTAATCYAAYYLLSEDRFYFKLKGEVYEPRSVAQVAELKHQHEKEAQRLAEEATFTEHLAQALAGEAVQWSAGDRKRLEQLERYAIAIETSAQHQGAVELLRQLKRPTQPLGAFQLLVDLGLWSTHENLFLRRSQIQVEFSAKVLDVAHNCLNSPPTDIDADLRRDLTHLKVYTIDDESTQEIDDGLSVEVVGDRQKLWIHIADPSRWVMADDVLDHEARRRATTVYLPTGIIPMFPSELATGPMSLVEGRLCCALSFGILLAESGEVLEYEICPSWIRPTYRLSYDDVDMILEQAVPAEADLLAIAHWGNRRSQWRQQRGAIRIDIPEPSIKVAGEEVEISPLRDSPARQLVAEMMILAGEVAADYGLREGIPLPFRCQSPPELPPDDELRQLPAGVVRDCAIRRCMPRSEMSTQPNPHASLGLDAYCQVTSPIRRYTDLLAHRQIKAHLRGETPPLTPEQLNELLLRLVSSIQESSLVERQTNRYWCLEYLRRHRDEVWRGILLRWLRPEENLGLVLLEDLGVELAMRLQRQANLGESLLVRASRVDPRSDQIWLEEVSEVPSSPAATVTP